MRRGDEISRRCASFLTGRRQPSFNRHPPDDRRLTRYLRPFRG